jgi:MobA/MobL family protein
MTGVLDWSHHRHGSWFHCSVDTVKRSAGRSAVAAAAYVTGKKLREEGREEPHDYSRRAGVLASFTIAPADAPEWVFEPEALWNAAEKAERRSNSVVARKSDIALPHAADAEEREAIAADIARELVRRYDVAVTVAIHKPDRHGDQRNDHAHFLWTTREVTEEGLGKKTRILDDVKTTGPKEIASFREFVADRINQALADANSDERVTAQSYSVEGIDRVPTTHLGRAASGMERKGKPSSRGELNRRREARNAGLAELVEEYAQAEAEIVATEERKLDERYGPLEERRETVEPILPAEDPADVTPAIASEATPEECSALGKIARTIEEERAQLAADAAPFERQLRQDRDIRQDGLGSTWWERASAYGQDLARHALDRVVEFNGMVAERVRGAWEKFVEGRRDPEQSSPERGPDLER